jgi:hypothetical protein
MMASRDRIAAVKRARERQARIETATTRVSRAQRRVEQSRARRQRALEAADSKVSDAELELAREVNALVTCCGSTEYAAEILELDQRAVRKMTAQAQRNDRRATTDVYHEGQRSNIER